MTLLEATRKRIDELCKINNIEYKSISNSFWN